MTYCIRPTFFCIKSEGAMTQPSLVLNGKVCIGYTEFHIESKWKHLTGKF